MFTRALGMPADPVDATGRILAALTGGGRRTIGVGLAQDRYFTVNAGLGFDAEVVRAIEGLRADGQEASAGLYVWTAIRHFYGVTNRRQPALALELTGRPTARRLFFAIVSNAAPWTYLGSRPVNPSPEAGFDTGLDVFALRTLAHAAYAHRPAPHARLSGQAGRRPGGGTASSTFSACMMSTSSFSAPPARSRSRLTGSTSASASTWPSARFLTPCALLPDTNRCTRGTTDGKGRTMRTAQRPLSQNVIYPTGKNPKPLP